MSFPTRAPCIETEVATPCQSTASRCSPNSLINPGCYSLVGSGSGCVFSKTWGYGGEKLTSLIKRENLVKTMEPA